MVGCTRVVIGARDIAVIAMILGLHLVPLCEGKTGVSNCIGRCPQDSERVRRQQTLTKKAAYAASAWAGWKTL